MNTSVDTFDDDDNGEDEWFLAGFVPDISDGDLGVVDLLILAPAGEVPPASLDVLTAKVSKYRYCNSGIHALTMSSLTKKIPLTREHATQMYL